MFDVGANIGYYALLAASLLEGRGAVHAFEPSPVALGCLRRNAHLNGFRCLKVNQMAVSDRDGPEPLFLPSNPDARTNASLIEGFVEQNDQILVESTRLDSYCRRNRVARVDLLRVDVEGAEIKVLRGMNELLDAWLPDIICEVLEPYQDELESFFRTKPYLKYLITDRGLVQVERIRADARYRDFYLTCSPPSFRRSEAASFRI